ncbi:MAG TPA: L-2-hydroxyglutarate oxidase [Candidatus Limnocylindrales bacterium]|nr:L-2-hydroxyglutarate oxidase [Candidatus Limnocylindrales bacterium]
MPELSTSHAIRSFDLVVVGAGILGLATAREYLQRRPGARLGVLEKEARIAAHQTGRNSGVIHSGVYYTPGSLKATLCVRGAAMLRAYCAQQDIPVVECGKVIVATREAQLARLAELHRRGQANGVKDLRVLRDDDIPQIEPAAAGIAGLHVPHAAIVDYGAVARAFAQDVARMGGDVMLGREVRAIRRLDGRWRIETGDGAVDAAGLIVCAGLHADRLALMTGAARDPRIIPFRGDYWALDPEQAARVRGLVYPVPNPRFPFLGIHATRRIDGSVWLGPNAVLAFAREGYRVSTVRAADLRDALAWPGFRRLAWRYWRTGLLEMARDLSQTLYVREAARYLPGLRIRHVTRAPAGVRAQAVSADGRMIDDFVFSEEEGVLHVRNAPSPAATSSLAIAERIVDRFLDAGHGAVRPLTGL